MLQKKICLLGAFSVGKTSLIKQFVSSLFDEKYLTTVGVKIDKKILSVDQQELMLMIWDLAGEDDYNTLNTSHLRGAAGCIIVVDGTRSKTLDVALEIHKRAKDALGDIPFVIAINKYDLIAEWTLGAEEFRTLEEQFPVILTSAKTGAEVETLFTELSKRML